MYQAGDLCVESAAQVFAYAAAQCEPVSGGQAVTCSATPAGVQVQIGSATTLVVPQLVDCADPLDSVALAWMVVLVLVTAWAFKAVGDTTK